MKCLSSTCACVLLFLACTAAWAQHVTVDFKQVPLKQALAALERQTGAIIQPGSWAPDAEQLRLDLQMQDAPLRAALRALCRQIGWHFDGSGFRQFNVQPGPDPADTCPAVQVGPYTVRLRSIQVVHATGLTLERTTDGPLALVHETGIGLTVEADEDRDLVAVINPYQGVTAVDNTGTRLGPKRSGLPLSPDPRRSWAAESPLPCRLTLDPPSPRATSLRTLEGDILVHQDVQQLHFEFPLAEDRQPQSAAGHTVSLTGVEPIGKRGLIVQAQWQPPARPRNETDRPWLMLPYWGYLAAGGGERVYAYSLPHAESAEGADPTPYLVTWYFQPAEGVRPRAFVFECPLLSDETDTLHYKFENIPLPTGKE